MYIYIYRKGVCTIPIIEHNFMTFFFFAVALVSVTLGFMNLILAVIVDHASQAREGDKEEQIKNRKEQDRLLMDEWRDLFAEVDANDDGLLSQNELISCYQNTRIRDKLNMMGIDGSDLEVIIDNSKKDPETGRISYEAFLDTFIKAGRQTNQTYLMFCKLHLESVGRGLKTMRSEVDELKRMNSQGGMSSPKGSFSHNPQGSRSPTGSGQKRSGKEPAAAQGAALQFEDEMAGLGQRLREQFQGVMVSLEAAGAGERPRQLGRLRRAREREADGPRSSRRATAGCRAGRLDERPRAEGWRSRHPVGRRPPLRLGERGGARPGAEGGHLVAGEAAEGGQSRRR